jgi:pimeloyl-ACP methyl ester carboxylesterase
VTTTRLNGIEIHFERSGTGPRLLFLNGSGSTLANSGFLLAPFRARCEVVAHDQRGTGETSVPPGPYTMADYASDALALLDHLGWERCRVVGVSFGGMVAQELAVTRPDRVERLALLCTSPGGAGGSSYPLHDLPAVPAEERAAIRRAILDSRFDDAWLAAHPMDRMIEAQMRVRAEAERSAEQRRGEDEQLGARRHHDVWDRLPSITCPTFVACGRYDGIAPLANSEAIVRRVPQATLHVYEGGHAFFLQDKSALADVVAFLAS